VTPDEVTQRLRSGGIKLSFDTNALFAPRKLATLCADVARWNEHLSRQKRDPVQLAVCAAAHAERLFDLKQQYKGTFDMRTILDGLQHMRLEIEPITVKHALEMATLLAERYPNTAAWHEAKRIRYLQSLGLDPKTTQAPGTGQKCGATIDWLIGAHARAENSILVTDDKGPEFKGVRERVSFNVLASAVQQLVGASS
jgi:hypothetical protein